jgi:hypothetical protein
VRAPALEAVGIRSWSRNAAVPGDHRRRPLEVEWLGEVRKGAVAAQEGAEGAAGREEDAGAAVVALFARPWEQDRGVAQLFVLFDHPGVGQVLARVGRHPLLVGAVELVGAEREFAAHEVEQHPGDLAPSAGIGVGQGGMRRPVLAREPLGQVAAELLLVGDALVEVGVADLDQAGLLEVGGGEAPAHLVGVDPVGDDLVHGAVALRLGAALEVGGGRVVGRCQAGLRERPRRHLGVVEAVLAGRGGGLVERRAQQADLDEVVEVAGLQRGVLAVVGEAEDLAPGLLHPVDPAQVVEGAEAEDVGRGAAAARPEAGELGEVRAQPGPVGDAAGEAEAERRREERRLDPGRVADPGAVDADRGRQVPALRFADRARVRVEPVGRHPVEDALVLAGPGIA